MWRLPWRSYPRWSYPRKRVVYLESVAVRFRILLVILWAGKYSNTWILIFLFFFGTNNLRDTLIETFFSKNKVFAAINRATQLWCLRVTLFIVPCFVLFFFLHSFQGLFVSVVWIRGILITWCLSSYITRKIGWIIYTGDFGGKLCAVNIKIVKAHFWLVNSRIFI